MLHVLQVFDVVAKVVNDDMSKFVINHRLAFSAAVLRVALKLASKKTSNAHIIPIHFPLIRRPLLCATPPPPLV